MARTLLRMRVAVALALLSLAPRASAASATAPAGAPAAPAAPAAARPAEDGPLAPRLAPSLHLGLAARDARLAVDPAPVADGAPPPCVADFCQPRVDVPGIEGFRRRASRTELVVALLDRAQIEPIASIAWFFVVTGLRVDWTPAAMDESFGATAGGWGNVFVRLRMRLDPWNLPTLPVRPRDRMRRAREAAAERARVQDAERLRLLAAPAQPATPAPGATGGANVAVTAHPAAAQGM